MLDYHLHLWPHEDATTWLSLDQVAEYCETAAAQGVTQLALTEHLHRFTQARRPRRAVLGARGRPARDPRAGWPRTSTSTPAATSTPT